MNEEIKTKIKEQSKNMNNLNKELQQKIGELIGKDYFKLEFGMEILLKDKGTFMNENICLFEYKDLEGTLHCRDKETMGYWQIESHRGFEILGQEPTLNDVLLAIGKKGLDIFIDTDGYLWIRRKDTWHLVTLTSKHIDLEKSIFNQTDKVKQQLLDLITK